MIKIDPATGLWRTDFTLKGKRIRKSFDSRKEARDFEVAAKLTAKFGVAVNNQEGKPLDEAIKEYIDLQTSKKETNKGERVILREFYRFLVNEQNLSAINEVKLIHLNKYQDFLQKLDSRIKLWKKVEEKRRHECLSNNTEYFPTPKPMRPLSGSSVNRHMNSICDLFTWAKRWDWIDSNPTAELDRVEENPNERKPWPSNESIQSAIDLAKPSSKRVFYFLAQTGARPIAAKKLIWKNVNFENRIIVIESKKGKNGTTRLQELLMTDALYDFMKQMWSERKVGKFAHLVFHSENGLPIDVQTLGKEMARITSKLGLEGYTMYGFRHSVGKISTNPSKDGSRSGNIRVAQMLLGHASISQTQNYSELDKTVWRQEAEKISQERNLVFRKEG